METTEKSIMEADHLSHYFNELHILDDINFSVAQDEFISILGPSGCGKSTILHLLAGLEKPDRGKVICRGKEIGTDAGNITGHAGFMHQKDLLLPWKTVTENAAVPLQLKGIPKKEHQGTVKAHLVEFGLEGFEDYYPSQLSGGMRQRVAFLRTWLFRNDLLLLDEPFGALDAITRYRMQDWLLKIREHYQSSMIMVTHDVEEALFLSDRIIVLSNRPSQIIGDIAITFPHPRSRNLDFNHDFIALKKEILTLLE